MSEYLFIITGGHNKHDAMTDIEKEKYYQRWGAYIESLNAKNAFVGGAPVMRTGKILKKELTTKRIGSLNQINQLAVT